MRRTVVALALILVSTALAASAATLGLASAGLAAGSSAVPRCDLAVTADLVVDEDVVTAVDLDDLAPACAGAHLQLALLDGTGDVLATGALFPVPAAGPFTVPLDAPHPEVPEHATVRLALTGPVTP